MKVRKYGGASLASSKHIISIAQDIARLKQQGETILVVVSAMGNTTNELLQLAYQMSPIPNRRELDMLLTTGERVSMTLLSMALQSFGCSAISFTGSQAGVLTTESHSQAMISSLKPYRVEQELARGKVVVLAGFQGVHPDTKEITTLGRGGSDTSAVAMAAHFKADSCEILKEVRGVFSADPALIQNAILFDKIPLSRLRKMCFWGAKMLHSRSCDLADRLSVPLFIGYAKDPSIGTKILSKTQEVADFKSSKELTVKYEDTQIDALTSIANLRTVDIKVPTLNEAHMLISKWMLAHNLPDMKVLLSRAGEKNSGSGCRLVVTADDDQFHVLQLLESSQPLHLYQDPLCSVTVHGFGVSHSDFIEKSLSQLNSINIFPLEMQLTSETATFFLKASQKEAALSALHSLWIS